MNSEDHEVIPVNSKCSESINNLVISNKPGSATATSSNNIDSINYQQKEYSKYDNTEEIYVKPMFGGNNKYNIKFINKNYNVIAKNEIDAIKIVLKNRIFKIDHLLIINGNQIYIIRGRYKNKFKKI